MLPIAPLMIEHRLIERMIEVIRDELGRMSTTHKADPVFVDTAVEFIRTYADQTHHGKEEDILFREVRKKPITSEQARILEELIQDHVRGRKLTGELVAAKQSYQSGNTEALGIIIEKFQDLADFYPKHIEKEDKRFFLPVMKYFSKQEQQNLLEEGRAFDRKMIHRKYLRVVKEHEQLRRLPTPADEKQWLDFL